MEGQPERSQRKSIKKSGVQICTVFLFPQYDDIKLIMKKEGRWFKETDFIREAVQEKIEKWKKENPRHGND